jgi:Uma2 family endonuclease
MRMATKTRPWTRADLDRLPDDGNRYEVLDGALLVTPQAAFDHQRAATILAARLLAYCESHGIGSVVAPGAVPRGKSELQPDVQVIPGPRPRRGAKWTALPKPILVVEVLSDPTRARDFVLKREAYERWQIPEYWIVDLEARAITVVRPGQADLHVSDRLEWRPLGNEAPLVIDVGALFG